jgi:hypothetical protein
MAVRFINKLKVMNGTIFCDFTVKDPQQFSSSTQENKGTGFNGANPTVYLLCTN